MFILFGIKTARIKKYVDHRHHCDHCKSPDLTIDVSRDYFHIFYIPFFPLQSKSVRVQCNKCRIFMKDGEVKKFYRSLHRTPFYLFSGLILLLAFITFIIILNLRTQDEKALFVSNPKVGDVYRMRKDENNSTYYYFLRISEIKEDTVYMYHNNFEYSGFTTSLNAQDYFVKSEEWIYTKTELKNLLKDGEINSIDRSYRESEGFNRLK